jgi:hypothetical protein
MGRKNNTQTRRGLKMGLIFFVWYSSHFCVYALLYILLDFQCTPLKSQSSRALNVRLTLYDLFSIYVHYPLRLLLFCI